MLDPIAGGTPGITEVGGLETKHDGNNVSVDRFLAGGNQELHGTVPATQGAELTFELFLQVRNKVDQEVMRMQM